MSFLKHSIRENVQQLLREIPPGIKVVAAAKAQPVEALREALDAGITVVGENYVQETLMHKAGVARAAEWHCIGYLQKNKIKKAVEIFDAIQTIGTFELAGEVNKRCASLQRVMPVFIEVNSGREPQKSGVLPEKAEELIRSIAALPHLEVRGLMTMGPAVRNPEEIRPYFKEARAVFEHVKALNIAGIQMRELSMGMSDSYRVAIEEGATMIRIGTKVFG